MSRITEAERKRFHKILDDSIDKLNSSKNIDKEHWSNLPIPILQKSINVENAELELVVNCHPDKETDIIDEGYDIINYSLFLIDNLRSNR